MKKTSAIQLARSVSLDWQGKEIYLLKKGDQYSIGLSCPDSFTLVNIYKNGIKIK